MCVFVEDLVSLILDSHEHWWQRDFPRLARVSSVWLQPVRKHLYARPSLPTYRACRLLAHTLDANASLIPLVHSLDLRPTSASCWAYEDPDACNVDLRLSVPRLLALTCLERLTIAGDLAEHAERSLRAVAAPHTLTELRIEGARNVHSDFCALRAPQASLEWDIELSQRFRALKCLALVGPLTLDVDDSQFDYYDEHSSLAHPRCCLLEELCLDMIDMAPASGGLSALLCSPAAWTRLRTLTVIVEDASLESNCLNHISIMGPSLECFTFQDRTKSSRPPFAYSEQNTAIPLSALPALRAARVVRLFDVSISPAWLNNLSLAFSGVEDLEVGENGGAKTPLDVWAQFLGKCELKRLKTLTLGASGFKHLGRSGITSESEKALEDACATRGIELRRNIHY